MYVGGIDHEYESDSNKKSFEVCNSKDVMFFNLSSASPEEKDEESVVAEVIN